MVAKSLMQIDVDSGQLAAAHGLTEKYNSNLAKMPGLWGKVAKAQQPAITAADRITGYLELQTQLMAKLVAQQEVSHKAWGMIESKAGRVLSHVRHITGHIAKWAGELAVFGALALGGLGAVDIAGMPGRVSANRRTALGLGVGIGQMQSFGINLSRFIDPGQMLAASRNARYDITSPAYVAMRVAGIDPNGQDPAQTSLAYLRRLPQMLKGYQENQWLTMAHALGVPLDDDAIIRIMRTPKDERERQITQAAADKKKYYVSDQNARKFQDLVTKVEGAGQAIETVFINKLAVLARPLEGLSDSVERTAKALLEGISEDTIKGFGAKIEEFAKYLTGPDFRAAMDGFTNAISEAASGVKYFVSIIPGFPGGGAEEDKSPLAAAWEGAKMGGTVGLAGFLGGPAVGAVTTAVGAVVGGLRAGMNQSLANLHNPAELLDPDTGGIAKYRTDAGSLRALAKQLAIYGSKDKLDTVSGIIQKYGSAHHESPSEIAAFIKDVAGSTGFQPYQHIDVSDRESMSKLISAMTKHYNVHPYDPQAIRKILLENTTGSSIVTSTAQTGGVQQ